MNDGGASRRTVLVVEDFEDTRYLWRLALEEKGYRVLEAADGSAAVETALRERPDIVLMDISLPVLDGFQATERLRSEPATKDLLILAVTAHNESEYRANARAAGFNAFVTKPVDFDWLDDLLKQLLPAD
ncbi:MAG TPA: response regulator [Pyrinomonadaceae bacterium]|nr:response regulator [Pyrinomonadaceae bacterium]